MGAQSTRYLGSRATQVRVASGGRADGGSHLHAVAAVIGNRHLFTDLKVGELLRSGTINVEPVSRAIKCLVWLMSVI